MGKRQSVVTIGGGTGHFVLLSGLKKYDIEITAIVSMADDGGSTGVLRDEMGVLPPGDIRQCLVALSEDSEMLRNLFSYRFENGSFSGHTFGNLFLSALEKINGNFVDGVKEASKILRVRGRVLPVTEEQMHLLVVLKDGTEIEGERALDGDERISKIGVQSVSLKEKVNAYDPALKAIENSDTIIIGPGDLYGSILPNFLISEISDAVKKNNAEVLYVTNLTNKKGQTEGFGIGEYVAAIESYIGKGRINTIIANNEMPSEDATRAYEKQEGAGTVISCTDFIPGGGTKIICEPLLSHKKVNIPSSDKIKKERSFIRHDSTLLTQVVMEHISN